MNNPKIRKIIIIILGALLVISICGAAVHEINYYRAERTYSKAEELIDLALITETEEETEAEIEPESEPVPETEAETEAETEPVPETEPFPETEVESETETETIPESETEAETVPESEPETKPVPETKAEANSVSKTNNFAKRLIKTDLTSLFEVNDDVFGWIIIPDTTVSYPLLQGEDNEHYLTYSWDKWWNPVGSIFLDYRNSRDMSEFHTNIYGHRMYDDSMFNSLQYYNDEEYRDEHPYVYILNEVGVLKYEVFSAYEAETDSPAWRLGFEKTEDQQLLIDYYIQESDIDAGFRPLAEYGQNVLTLTTCTKSGNEKRRWVVHCALTYILKHGE